MAVGRTLVVTSTFPQWQGDPRGGFIRRYWEARAVRGERVEVLAPRTRWCDGVLDGPLEVRRFVYAPRRWSTVSGRFGILENLRERPRRAVLVPAFVVGMRRALARRLEAERWDRVVAHMLAPCGVIAGPLAAASGVRLEVFGHGTDVDVILRATAPVRRLAEAALARAEVIHVPSRAKRRRLCERLPRLADRCAVATMVDTVVAEAGGRRPVPGRIVFLGRLIRQKGVDDLIRAVAGLRGRAHLVVAGDGPERARLQRLAVRLHAPVEFVGFVVGAAKREVLASAAVVCVPSRMVRGLSEGAPLVVREAAVLGVPIVATAVGGIPELLADQPRAHLVAPGDVTDLRRRLAAVVRQTAIKTVGAPSPPRSPPVAAAASA